MRPLILLLLFLSFRQFNDIAFGDTDEAAPNISPNPQPFLPLLGPSPMIPIINNSAPKLSGLCTLNFSSVESLLSVTATDCWDPFAPYLANVICCPQFEAVSQTLVGQSGRSSGLFALDSARSNHCLSDIETILASKGANTELRKICSVGPESLLTRASCPVASVDAFESLVDSTRLVSACEKIDRVNECCERVCHNAVSDAARRIALAETSVSNEERSKRVGDCRVIVLRWLASKLDPRSANEVSRVLSNCEINAACPLVFPDATSVVRECGPAMRGNSTCCEAVKDYASKLQEQSFITNVQALNCAAALGTKLQKENVTRNIYDLCHLTIKDFSLQVGSQAEFGCLLPSSPSDATYDRASGISFICDLNDNIAAPWPSSSFQHFSFCNKTTEIPALPKATSAQKGFHDKSLKIPLFFSFLAVLKLVF